MKQQFFSVEFEPTASPNKHKAKLTVKFDIQSNDNELDFDGIVAKIGKALSGPNQLQPATLVTLNKLKFEYAKK